MLRDNKGRFVKDKNLDSIICYACDSKDTKIKVNGRPLWITNKPTSLYLCSKCYANLIYHYTNRENNLLNSKYRVTFRDKRLFVGFNPRKGICSLCNKQGITQIHHIKYHKSDPLMDTIELCISCHTKQRIGIRKDLSKRFIVYWRNRWEWLFN